MDDLIYGLLVIAWVAYGIFSAVKKNKAKGEIQTASRPAASQSKDVVESIFESLFQGNSPNPLAASHPYSQADYVEEEIDEAAMEYEENDYLDVVPEPFIESEIDTYSGTDNVQQAILVEEEEYDEIKKSAIESFSLDEKKSDSSIFNLRQGIIAQAILERPYK